MVGKTASCAAMALTLGTYVWPGQAHAVAVAAVVALTAVNYAGVQKSAWLTRVIVAFVLAVLAAVVTVCLTGGTAHTARLDIGADTTVTGVLQAAGLLFFAFAGYARIATLGEEVRDPARTIPRAIPIALGTTLVVYTAVAVAVTALTVLAAVHPRFHVPYRAELAVGAVVVVLAATVDVRGAIGFSSFGVLAYYAIANAAAFTLTPAEGCPPRAVPALGLIGCIVLAFALPLASAASGAAVLALGAAVYGLRKTINPS